MKELDGYFNEEVLQELLYKGEIDHLSFVFHHSEEKKAAFMDYCHKNGLHQDDKAAQQFLKSELKEEEDSHEPLVD